MPGWLLKLWDDSAARLGIIGGAFVSLWMVAAYVGVPFVAGWIVRDFLFLVHAAGVLLERSVRYHVVALVVPGFTATVVVLSRFRRSGLGGLSDHAKTIGGIVLLPAVMVWVLMTAWVLLWTVALLVPSDAGGTPFVAVSNGVLFLFGGAFLAVFITPVVVAGVGSGAVLGSTVVAVGRRLFPPGRLRSGT